MKKRLDIENPLYDGDASASAFGWQFQVDAAIFLFLYYSCFNFAVLHTSIFVYLEPGNITAIDK